MRVAIRLTGIAVGLGLGGCAATSMMIKAPVAEQCAAQGVKSCPELVDGVLLYVDGNEAAAKAKFRVVATQNAPGVLKRFAHTLVSAVPGGGAVAGPLSEVAVLIAAQADEVSNPAVADARPPIIAPHEPTEATAALATKDEPDAEALAEEQTRITRLNHVMLALAAPLDPSRLLTETVSPLSDKTGETCDLTSTAARCVRRVQGPLVVTGAATPPGCHADMFVGAVNVLGDVAWFVQTNGAGVAGGAFFVRHEHWLAILGRADPKKPLDPNCTVTWSGFRPRMVPASL